MLWRKFAKTRHKIIHDLPIGGAGCGPVDFRTEGLNFIVTIHDVGRSGQSKIDITFEGFTAFRFRAELYSKDFLPGSYDCVCEILESDWVAQMIRDRPKGLPYLDMRHFAVLLSDTGYLEVACENLHVFTPTDEPSDTA